MGDMMDSPERRIAELSKILEITEKVNSGRDLDEVLQHIYDSFHSVIPYDRISLSLLVNDGKTVKARWARSEAPVLRIREGYQAPLEGSTLASILETGSPRILNDLEGYLKAKPQSQSTRLIVEEGMRSSLTCPLVAWGKRVGFLFFSSLKRDTYRDTHVDVFLRIANQLSTIVEKGHLYQQLVEVNQLRTQFLGMVIHDLRSPIGLIKGFTEILTSKSRSDLPEEREKMLGRIAAISERMLGLIDDLLDVSVLETEHLVLEMRKTNLSEYLSDFVEDGRLLVRTKQMSLDLEMDLVRSEVEMDTHRIDQVLHNLLSNAIKYSLSGSRIRMHARDRGEGVEIGITDEGPGISREEAEKLFVDFGKGSARPTGGERSTGLGLSIAKRIVSRHGGRIWVQSDLGKGSTFAIWLPYVAVKEA